VIWEACISEYVAVFFIFLRYKVKMFHDMLLGVPLLCCLFYFSYLLCDIMTLPCYFLFYFAHNRWFSLSK